MKLYATTTSERATKGQGGNKFISIDLMTGSTKESEIFATIRLNIINNVYTLWLDGEIVKERGIFEDGLMETRTKGERQKGELCENCGINPQVEDSAHGLCVKCFYKNAIK